MNVSNNDEKDPLEDFFNDRFQDFESDVDDMLWAKIAPELPLPSFIKLISWQLISVAALVLFVMGLLWFDPTEYEKNTLTSTATIFSPQKYNPKHILAIPSSQLNGSTIASPNTKETLDPSSKQYQIADGVTENSGIRLAEKQAFATSSKRGIAKYFTKKTATNKQSSERLPNSTTTKQGLGIGIVQDKPSATTTLPEYNLMSTNKPSEDYLTLLNKKDFSDLAVRFNKAKIKASQRKTVRYFKESKPVSFYMSAMPLVNYYTITPNSGDNNYIHDIVVNDDAGRIGVYLQAGLMFTLSQKLKLKTGLSYTKSSQSFSYQVRTDSLVIKPSDSQVADVAFAEINKVYATSTHYLGTRFDLQYTFLKGEALSHHLSLGMEGNMQLNGKNKINSFLNIGYGVSRQIGDNAYLFIEPTLSFALNNHTDESSLLLVRPNKIGFNIGMHFKIK